MRWFSDTSFLCALYREQDNSPLADAFMAKNKGPITVSSLVLWEFRQSARFQVFRNQKDQRVGFSKGDAARMMKVLEANFNNGVLVLETVDWADVHSIAEQLSAKHTVKGGHRPMDILHVATARHLKLPFVLTFDGNQKKLAEAEGFKVPV